MRTYATQILKENYQEYVNACPEKLRKIAGDAALQIEIIKKINLGEATMCIFNFDDNFTSSCIIYEDGTLFCLRDWQGAHPETAEEIEEFDWIREDGATAYILQNLPRVL